MRCQRTHIFFTFHFTKAILEMVHRVFHALPPQQKAFFKDACLGKQRVEAGNIGAAALALLGEYQSGMPPSPFAHLPVSRAVHSAPCIPAQGGRPQAAWLPFPRPANAALERMEPKATDVFHVTAPLSCAFLLRARAKEQLCMPPFQFNRAGRTPTL